MACALAAMGLAAFGWIVIAGGSSGVARGADAVLVKPPALPPDGTIALVAPASPADATHVREAERNLRRLGYGVKLLDHGRERDGYLADSDEARAWQIDQAFADPEVDMILCIRGGYGSPRILGLLDYAAMRRHPKILVGYSDITALLTAVRQRAGIVTFHGPMAEKDFSGKYGLAPFASRYLWNLVQTPDAASRKLFREWGAGASSRLGRLRTVAQGVAEGRIVGGNLSTVCALMGTPYELQTDGAILFIEDVNEEPFHIDRMLCQLQLAGKLRSITGALLGAFTNCVARNPRASLSIDEVVDHYFGNLGIPVLAGFPAGHLPEQASLPLGSRVRLDATRKLVALLESPVASR